jgi:transcription termination/antitermination protein NusA
VSFDERNKRVEIEVNESDLALVIGRRGQNARLTQRLIGYKLEIVKAKAAVADIDTKKAAATATLGQDILGKVNAHLDAHRAGGH